MPLENPIGRKPRVALWALPYVSADSLLKQAPCSFVCPVKTCICLNNGLLQSTSDLKEQEIKVYHSLFSEGNICIPRKKRPRPVVYLLDQRSPQEIDLPSHKQLKFITHEHAKVSTWQHLDFLRFPRTAISFEHSICVTGNVFLGYMHQQRRGSDFVDSRGWEVRFYSFETVLLSSVRCFEAISVHAF
jgi:hypothetical protein